jgi:tetratricopeptide (TPR) repeat protein
VIELDPKNGRTFYDRAVAFRLKQDYDRAISDFGEAIKLNAGDARSYAGRASSFLSKRAYKEATADYAEVIHLNPNDRAAFYTRRRLPGAAGQRTRRRRFLGLNPTWRYRRANLCRTRQRTSRDAGLRWRHRRLR